MEVTVIYGWINDHTNQISYKKLHDSYLRRNADGTLEIVPSVPTFIAEFLMKQHAQQRKAA